MVMWCSSISGSPIMWASPRSASSRSASIANRMLASVFSAHPCPKRALNASTMSSTIRPYCPLSRRAESYLQSAPILASRPSRVPTSDGPATVIDVPTAPPLYDAEARVRSSNCGIPGGAARSRLGLQERAGEARYPGLPESPPSDADAWGYGLACPLQLPDRRDLHGHLL